MNGKHADGKIRASHLLVKHKDSRRPSSWREVCSDRFLIGDNNM
jgi:hypothetical protein